MTLYSQTIETPIGSMLVCSTELSICLFEFKDGKHLERHLRELKSEHACQIVERSTESVEPIERLKSELNDYFNGTLSRFTVPIRFPASTPFQNEVWSRLIEIPFGEKLSYADLAGRIGRPRSFRPVAQAVGQNRLMILVPCHRIVGSNGSLTGFAGGIERKRQLLAIEALIRC